MKKSKEKVSVTRKALLPASYKRIIKKVKDVYLAIVGKAPYPQQPVGIPFCKETWKEIEAHNCSGLYVLRSLGISISKVKQNYTPVSLFEKLARLGIVFLNVSYDLINGPLRKKSHKESLRNALQINSPIFKKATHIILCGDAKKNFWFGDNLENFKTVIHPDIRNRSKKRWHSWSQTWSDEALAKEYEGVKRIVGQIL